MNRRKTILSYGLGAGIFMVSGWFVTNTFFIDENGNWDFTIAEIAGYTAMILSLSTIFIGVKQYRDKENDGVISFKQAFLTGLYITLVASAVYVIGWMCYYPFIGEDFANQYLAHHTEIWNEEGLSPDEISANTKDMKEQFEAYKNPFFRIGLTFLEVFPVGLIISLIAAFIFKREAKTHN
ncbi:MAG: DUF4199 domain-containing protein [Cyclobacteriaceae bacterium]